MDGRQRSTTATAATATAIGFGLVTAIGVASCGGGDGGGGGKTLGVAEWPEAWAKAMCGKMFRCCSGDERAGLFGVAQPDEAGCVAAQRSGFLEQSGRFRALEKAGRIAWRGDRAAACVAEVSSSPCSSTFGGADPEVPALPAACAQLVAGKVALGAACDEIWECASGNCAQGFCRAGPRCESDATCGEGSFCDSGRTGLCTTRRAAGTTCAQTRECAADAYCDPAGALCAARLADGADCTDSDQCRGGSSCRVVSDERGGTTVVQCVPLKGAGESCEVPAECATGLTCDPLAAAVCEPAPPPPMPPPVCTRG